MTGFGGILSARCEATPSSQDWSELTVQIVNCRLCPRLVAWREEVALRKRRAYQSWEYWGRPVPGFGDLQARVLVVGLAPGAHGANRTGRMFTGDGSGEFLARALYRQGFANQPHSLRADDGLVLKDVFLSAVCRCAPPANKPTFAEIANCLPYLAREITLLPCLEGFVALGRIAFDHTLSLLREMGYVAPSTDFGHGRMLRLEHNPLKENLKGYWLLASYHPSRQNTQTGRLTEAMFEQIWIRVKQELEE